MPLDPDRTLARQATSNRNRVSDGVTWPSWFSPVCLPVEKVLRRAVLKFNNEVIVDGRPEMRCLGAPKGNVD